MSKLTEKARGRDCQIRLPGICNGNPETTVAAHFRMAGLCGTGLKPHDVFVAWSCSACHDEVDRRTRLMPAVEVRLAHLEGVMRTQDQLLREGAIKA